MRIRWTGGHTIWDRIKNKVIKEKVGVVLVEDKMSEARFQWFDHVKRSINALIWTCEKIRLPDCKSG